MPAELANPSSAAPGTPPWLWPHVLSLEAPAVAMLWLAALARINDFRLMPGVLPGLGLAVWLIYLADRVLDTIGVPPQQLSARHLFYRRFRWPLVLAVIPAVAATVAWLALWVVPVGLLAHSLAQVLPIGLYLVLYSITGRRTRRWLIQAGVLVLLFLLNTLPLPATVMVPVSLLIAGATILVFRLNWDEQVGRFFRKEVAAGLLFAFGCTTWTRFHALGSEGPDIWAELVLLGLLFVSNLTVITAREEAPAGAPGSGPGSVRGAIALCVGALAAIQFAYLPATLVPLTWAVLAGLVGLEILWQKRRHLSPEAFRVWADVIVAIPAAVLLLMPEASSSATDAAACCL
ncbi:hypothetical protein WJU23_14580 [Prosthecobacter sp. SYSU 5D2]|uniref:hypothetical protein n=1 Tax=Prosthecobacter sp. SYSU 5D2 TaxID=3134134 RepID=UPI0031FF18D5